MNLTMKLTKLLRVLWPVLLCAVVWQLLQFAPADQWWWLQKAMSPLTTTMIFLAVWRYSDRQQPTTWLLLVALVLFAVADSLVAFLPFSHLIVGLGVSLLAYLVLCVINLWRLIFALAKGAARHINWALLLATFMGNAIMVYSTLHNVLPRVGSPLLAGAIKVYAAVLMVLMTSGAAAALTDYRLRWSVGSCNGTILAASESALALQLFSKASEAWIIYSIMPLYWCGLVSYVAASRPKKERLTSRV